MKRALIGFAIVISALALAACASNNMSEELTDVSQSPKSIDVEELGPICGEETVELIAGQHIDVGEVNVANTEEEIIVTYNLTDGWKMSEAHMHIGCVLSDIPQTKKGNPIPGQFDYKVEFEEPVDSYAFVVPFAEIGCDIECNVTELIIAAHAAVVLIDDEGNVIQGETAWGEGPGFPGNNWAMYFYYLVACCEEPPPPPECDEQLRTQTQGGWGTECHGDNPGCYRDDSFDAAIGTLVMGNEAYYTLTLTSSEAVEVFLPQGGPPAELLKNHIDPTDTEAGVLAGQLTALSLSVAFDLYDPDFGESDLNLKDMYAQVGPCAGMTVEEILVEANLIISGSGMGSFEPSQINDCLDIVNNAFVDGDTISGRVCPSPPEP